MPRILADLPDDDIQWLDRLSAERGVSRAALLREAVTAYRAKDRDWLDAGFGLWTRHGQGAEGDRYEQDIRAGWDEGQGA
ncbi:MAG: ribbon-helix-helix protein, CopG family [Sphingomonadaceae bacterium]|nr:ribbon-helix-helix protein, CopG family [Sphingomonadaceae bacterium]